MCSKVIVLKPRETIQDSNQWTMTQTLRTANEGEIH